LREQADGLDIEKENIESYLRLCINVSLHGMINNKHILPIYRLIRELVYSEKITAGHYFFRDSKCKKDIAVRWHSIACSILHQVVQPQPVFVF